MAETGRNIPDPSGVLPSIVRRTRSRALAGLTALLTLFLPTAAWAVQTHGSSEGLVAHQLGHLLFFIALAYLLYRLRSISMPGAGWGGFKVFLWLLVCWNVLTFTGHWMNESIPAGKFLRQDGRIVAMKVESLSDAIFYLTRLDHLLLVPAMVALLLALRKWRRS